MKIINRGRFEYNGEPLMREVEVSDEDGLTRLRDFAGSTRFCFERADFKLKLDQPVPQDERVTVLMPVFNGQDFVEQSANSILAQTYKNLELIICDDGSTDATPAILKGIADRDLRVRLMKNKKNQGVGAARKKLLESCKTRLVAWHDADDIAYPKRIERQVQGTLELEDKFPDRKFMVYVGWQWIRSDGMPEEAGCHKQFNCLLFSRNEGTPGIDPATRWGEDTDWHAAMIDAGYCEADIPEVLQGYRRHPGSLTSQHHGEGGK